MQAPTPPQSYALLLAVGQARYYSAMQNTVSL